MYGAAEVIGGMMRSLRQDIQTCLIMADAGLAISPHGEIIGTLPELRGSDAPGVFNPRERLAGVMEDLLLQGSYDTVVHEFAHAVERLCFSQDEHSEWNSFYQRAKEADLFPYAYGMKNAVEFFAEFSVSYFHQPSEIQWRWDEYDEELTRQKLSADFPEIFSFLAEIYEGWAVGSYLIPYVGSPDRDTLTTFYNSTGGPNWANSENWLSEAPIRYWHGVQADWNGRVTWLDISENGLTGELPPELGNLANLWRLDLRDNQLSGEIPPELGNLTKLVELNLADNRLSGKIPPKLGNLTKLVELGLADNRLSGKIPPELGNLTNLERMILWKNQLSGELPPELGNLTNLIWLVIQDNRFSGEIPPKLGNLTNLEILGLTFNRLTGQIPTELTELVNLKSLWLSRNPLSGCIPDRLREIQENDLARLGLPSC